MKFLITMSLLLCCVIDLFANSGIDTGYEAVCKYDSTQSSAINSPQELQIAEEPQNSSPQHYYRGIPLDEDEEKERILRLQAIEQEQLEMQLLIDKSNEQKEIARKETLASLNETIISNNLTKSLAIAEKYRESFGGELPVEYKSRISTLVKKLPLIQIKTLEQAEYFFTPTTNLMDWYLKNTQGKNIQFGGKVVWVTGNTAEVQIGNISYLIKFNNSMVVRKNFPCGGFGKPVGNVTYRTALGSSRTLPCLQVLWLQPFL